MRNAMFFPNRILYREELLSTTVTYAVDLSETDHFVGDKHTMHDIP